MSEQQNNPIEWRPAPMDGILGALVSWCNQGAQLGITISVKGILISGLLVGYKEYSQNFANVLEQAGVEKVITEAFRQAFEVSPEESQTLPRFVHIKNARFFLANGQPIDPSNTPIWWRCRIDQIDGFFLGEIS